MKIFALRSLCSLRLNRRMSEPVTPRFQPSSSLPKLARVIADGKLRKDLRQQRNKLARAGDAEAAAAIDALLKDATAARGGEEIPFTVMISPNLFHGLQKLKSWGKHDSLPGMAEEILSDAVRAELRARLAKGYDVPQRLVEEFLLQTQTE